MIITIDKDTRFPQIMTWSVTTVPVVTVGGFGYTFDDVVTGQSSLTTGHMNLLDSLLKDSMLRD